MSCLPHIHPLKCHRRVKSSLIITLCRPFLGSPCSLATGYSLYFKALLTGPACGLYLPHSLIVCPSLPFTLCYSNTNCLAFSCEWVFNVISLSSYFPSNHYLLFKIQPKSQMLQKSSLNDLSPVFPPHIHY